MLAAGLFDTLNCCKSFGGSLLSESGQDAKVLDRRRAVVIEQPLVDQLDVIGIDIDLVALVLVHVVEIICRKVRDPCSQRPVFLGDPELLSRCVCSP